MGTVVNFIQHCKHCDIDRVRVVFLKRYGAAELAEPYCNFAVHSWNVIFIHLNLQSCNASKHLS